MTEGTCKDGLQVKRLDRTRPPPGYTLTPSCGVWVADERGELIREDESFDDEASAIAAAWAHYEREHDPPGLVVWLDALAGDDVWWWGDENRNYGPEEREEADARAAAWAWYWRRVAVSLETEREEQVKVGEAWVDRRLLLADHEIWPRCLAWPDEQVAAVERWLAEGGELPEVLRA